MWRFGLLGILWAASIVGLTSADAVMNCVDGAQCKAVRVIAQNPGDVREVIRRYPQAESVDFHGNLLEKMFEGSPNAMPQWKMLNMSYNLLSDDPFQRISRSQLEVVDLTYNQLERVTVPSSVTEFIAERNKLHSITVDQGGRLQRLILSKNKFTSLDPFKSLRNLQELDLSCNDISELKVDEISSSLKTLVLARNHIHVISGSRSLHSLNYLDLSNNILTVFADSQSIFPNVETLDLQNNKIVMWLPVNEVSNRLVNVNLNDNDWDCTNLASIVKKHQRKLLPRTSRDNDCRNEGNICCTESASPYSDRLIRYRKKEFAALQEGTSLRTGNATRCSEYEPNPCDGDDSLVYRVAGSAVQDAESLAKKNLQDLEGTLRQAENLARKIENDVNNVQNENDRLSKEHADLVAYIGSLYQELPPEEQVIKAPREEVAKLQGLFSYYEKENARVKQLINAEERKNQDKLDEINVLENEAEDLNYRKGKLEEEVMKRNTTVQSYNTRIAQLQKQLSQK